MSLRLPLKIIPRLNRLSLIAVLLTLVSVSFGQVCQSFTYSTFISSRSSPVTISNFRAGGFFAIAGGVVFQGHSTFYLENPTGKHAISAADVHLTTDSRGNVFLVANSDAYRLEIHRGLACPLGKFVERNGSIVYTVPPVTFVKRSFTDAELSRQQKQFDEEGVTLVKDRETGQIMGLAKEFFKTPFENLIMMADFANKVSLPPNLSSTLIANVNSGSSVGESRSRGTYINSDSQTIYQVYLMSTSHRVETAGVPLRFTWNYAAGGARVIRIEALSQSWPSGMKLTNFNVSETKPTQYDIISLFQNAGIFRQLQQTDPSAFDGFVNSACKQ